MLKKLSVFGIFIGVATLTFSASVSAHVVVKPAEVIVAGFQTFTVNVPNEKDISTTNVKLIIPANLKHVQPTQKNGWQINIEKDGAGETATIQSITWSGNEIKAGFRDEFTFSGQVPGEATELQWKAHQTYADGTVVSWDKPNENGHSKGDSNSGPFSVTRVVAGPTDASIEKASQAAADSRSIANTALYIGSAGIIIGLIGVYLGTRNK